MSEAKNAMDKLTELGVDLKSENLTTKDAGRVGGTMAKRLIEKAKQNM